MLWGQWGGVRGYKGSCCCRLAPWGGLAGARPLEGLLLSLRADAFWEACPTVAHVPLCPALHTSVLLLAARLQVILPLTRAGLLQAKARCTAKKPNHARGVTAPASCARPMGTSCMANSEWLLSMVLTNPQSLDGCYRTKLPDEGLAWLSCLGSWQGHRRCGHCPRPQAKPGHTGKHAAQELRDDDGVL